MKNREDYIISIFSKKSSIIGDDGALICNTVYTKDAFFEDVHFKREWMSLFDIGYKSVLVNISDAIVMNSIARYALIVIAIPNSLTYGEIDDLCGGMLSCFSEYGITVIGGDTICNEKISITITLISDCKGLVTRSGASSSELVAYTGELGRVKVDLNKLQRGEPIGLNSKFIRPILRGDFFYSASRYITSAMDISDGLFNDLEKLSKASSIGFDFLYEIDYDIGSSAEEYEILFTFKSEDEKNIKALCDKFNIKLNIFAKTTNGSYTSITKNHHFS